MANVQQVQQKIDNKVNALLPEFTVRQEDYLAFHGHYWQGVRNPPLIPIDGADMPADPNLKPSDQLERWVDFFQQQMPTTMPGSLDIHTHSGPHGHGWTVYILAIINGDNYLRAVGNGPYGEDFPWTLLPQQPA